MSSSEKPAPIVDMGYIDTHRAELGKIVCTSGGYDPVHPGHLSCIAESVRYGDTLVVVVNGDAFLRRKKGKPFQDLETRARIMSYVKGVDLVVPFEIEDDMTVTEALRGIRPAVFTKGGDRSSPETIPEWGVCQALGIEVVTGVGDPKLWSSSDVLARWTSHTRGA